MKRWLIVVTVIGALIFSMPALAKKEKTGVLEKGLFTDSLQGYQFTLPYNWKLKTEKEPSLLRATLQKIKLENLPAGASQGYYGGERIVPTVVILADTTSLDLNQFAERLVTGKDGLPNEKQYLMKLDLLLQSELESRVGIKIVGTNGLKYTFQKKYLREVDDPRRLNLSQTGNKTVEESVMGQVIVFKNGNQVFMIQGQGERATFEFEDRDYQKLLESWKFIK